MMYGGLYHHKKQHKNYDQQTNVDKIVARKSFMCIDITKRERNNPVMGPNLKRFMINQGFL